MSNLNPTPIVDKNGKQTTVHKRVAGASKSNDRVAGLTAKPTVKKLAFKPGKYDYAKWSESDVVELGSKKESGSQDIYFNGRVIGSVSSNTETSTHKIAGTRLIRYGAQETTWRADTIGAEDPNMIGTRSSYGISTRASAVTEYVNDYLNNIVRKEDNRKFHEEGGISFGNRGTYGNTKLTANGAEIEVPANCAFSFNSWGGDKFTLKTEVAINTPKARATISPNQYRDTPPNVRFRPNNSREDFTANINEDGSLDLSQVDSDWMDRNEETVAVVSSITKQIIDSRR